MSTENLNRQIRVFISSTFRDMTAERDYLVKFIFPQLRKLCESRGVTWGEVDLRWGVTDEQAAEGKVLPICLEEIKRCRPYFIGLLGERYGWIPDALPADLLEREPWLKEHLHGKSSVTELEILHGVLHNPKMAGHAFFYFRDSKYIETLGGAEKKFFTAENAQDAEKLSVLKENIRHSGFPVRENYANPKELGELVLADLTQVINDTWPEGSQPDPLDREAMDHEAYAQSRERVYIRRKEYFDRLDTHAAANDTQPLVILGESGSGKSALLANWVARYRQAHPDALVLQHYIGATPYSADWAAMLRRIMGEFKRRLGLQQDILDQPDALRRAFPNWLYMAAAKGRVVIVLDALNQLEDRDGAPDLVWLPPVLPENVRLIVSTLPGRPLDEIQKRNWSTLKVELLSADERRKLIAEYLAQHAKSLNAARVERIAAAPPSANPLYLRVLLDELRLVRTHEELEGRIGDYLKAESPYALYEKVIVRWERDYEGNSDLVGDTLSLLWAARRGLTETELLQALGKNDEPLPRAKWSPLFLAMSDALICRSGLLTFAHDFLRTAVRETYLPSEENQQEAHLLLANYFQKPRSSSRRIDELPWQLAEASAWQRLYESLSNRDFFKTAWGWNQIDIKTYWARIEGASALRMIQAYRTQIERPDLETDSDLLWDLGFLLFDGGHPNESLRIRSELVGRYRANGDTKKLQGCLGNEAQIFHARGDFDQAMLLHKDEEEICRECGYSIGLQACLGNQASILTVWGKLDDAMTLLKSQESICRQAGYTKGLENCLNSQGHIQFVQGNLVDAQKLLKETEQTIRSSGDLAQLQSYLGNMGVILSAQNNLEAAMEMHKEEENICRTLGYLPGIPSCLTNQANILISQGNDRVALAKLKEGEHICRELGFRTELDPNLNAQARLFIKLGQLDKALDLLRELEDVCRELGQIEGLARCLAHRAVTLRKMQKFSEAQPLIEESYMLALSNGFTVFAEQIRPMLDAIREAAQGEVTNKSAVLSPSLPTSAMVAHEPSISEFRDSVATALKRGLWEAAETYLEKLLQQGEPVETVAPDLITALLNAHETVSPHTITRIKTLLAQLDSAGHPALAAQLRQQHAAKLAPPKKPRWRFWA